MGWTDYFKNVDWEDMLRQFAGGWEHGASKWDAMERDRKLQQAERTIGDVMSYDARYPGREMDQSTLGNYYDARRDLTGNEPVYERQPGEEPGMMMNDAAINMPYSRGKLAQPRGTVGQTLDAMRGRSRVETDEKLKSMETIGQFLQNVMGYNRGGAAYQKSLGLEPSITATLRDETALARGRYGAGGPEETKYRFGAAHPTTVEEALLSSEPTWKERGEGILKSKATAGLSPSQQIDQKKLDIISRYIEEPGSVTPEELEVAGLNQNYLSKAVQIVTGDLKSLTMPPDEKVSKIIEIIDLFEQTEKKRRGGGNDPLGIR